ncbi:hypothetical protein DLAC_03398 [Tieghemostelium lacteum]|uniref:Zinc-ribbon domain-containing protein n=1 Tax=Tieghemostelium lacteum TaxID=361077 RepID=A0A152A209_TIELA|nr:hypothetical protein DLAC_03398 [Tieghemostelium lacteum]|eukprot:KYR00239.1 hypothetical protein DLAC_03398 [Tieghemostelium lacteum]
MSSICPYCNKKVFFAERQFYKGKDYHMICHGLLIKEEQKSAPKVFAIHEQIFCNPEENSKHSYPLASKEPVRPTNCYSCKTPVKPDANFCVKCGTKVVI